MWADAGDLLVAGHRVPRQRSWDGDMGSEMDFCDGASAVFAGRHGEIPRDRVIDQAVDSSTRRSTGI